MERFKPRTPEHRKDYGEALKRIQQKEQLQARIDEMGEVINRLITQINEEEDPEKRQAMGDIIKGLQEKQTELLRFI